MRLLLQRFRLNFSLNLCNSRRIPTGPEKVAMLSETANNLVQYMMFYRLGKILALQFWTE